MSLNFSNCVLVFESMDICLVDGECVLHMVRLPEFELRLVTC